jgi:hypothetical protein
MVLSAMTLMPIESTAPNRRGRLWPMWAALTGTLVLGLGVAAVANWILWRVVGRPRLGAWDVQAQQDVAVISLVATAGLGCVAAIVISYRRQRIAEAVNTHESTRLLNERLAITSTQLGHESAAVRLAGVYALAGLADDWPAKRQTCVDILCGYLRMPYQPNQGEPTWREGEREVRLSIIRTIRDHLRLARTVDPHSWQGLSFDFTRATLDGGDFSGANFGDASVSFEGAEFVGSVSFMGARFTGGRVSFVGAQILKGNVYFADAVFAGGSVYFMDMRLTGGIAVFMGARFSGANVSFMGTQFSGTDVTFRDAQFTRGRISFADVAFTRGHVSFAGAHFLGGSVDLSQVRDWAGPVMFDPGLGPAGTPAGLILPNEVTLELTTGPE